MHSRQCGTNRGLRTSFCISRPSSGWCINTISQLGREGQYQRTSGTICLTDMGSQHSIDNACARIWSTFFSQGHMRWWVPMPATRGRERGKGEREGREGRERGKGERERDLSKGRTDGVRLEEASKTSARSGVEGGGAARASHRLDVVE
eukprot:3409588-Rhodomonas_salina.3